MANDEKENLPDGELSPDTFSELEMEEEPELALEIPQDGHRTLGELEREGGDQSDVKAIVRRLLPSFSDSEIDELDMLARSIMVSNVNADMFVEGMSLTVYSIVEKHAYDGYENTKPPLDVMMVINIIFGIYSPALGGKVRIELVELAGSAKESEEAEKVASKLGF